MSTLTWLTVPQCISGTDALLSVLVVPRLGAGRLGNFGLRDWPARLTEMSFEVRIRSAGAQSIADGRPTLVSVPDSEVWHAFFDGDAGTIADGSVRAAPQTPTVRDSYTEAVRTHDTHRTLAQSIAGDGVNPQVLEDQLAPWSQRRPEVEPDTLRTAIAPNVDFHRATALLREHPRVMRALGLVFDLVIDADLLDVGDPADRAIAIVSEDSPVPVRSSWTRYTLRRQAEGGHPAHFRAADHPSGLHRAGMLDIHTARSIADPSRPPDPGWLISTMDVEGAAANLGEVAQTISTGESVLLPRARSAGIALVRRGRKADYDALVQRARTIPDDPVEAELTAEDLVLGYRVDIRRGGGAWRSLCERDAGYTVRTADGRVLAIGNRGNEEGHVKPHSMLKRDDGTLETDEVMLRWDGWSLATPAPATEPARRTSTTMPYDFEWKFDVPRDPAGTPLPTLPALRFAERYRMRVRVADVTGGGPLLDEPDLEDAAGPSIVYTRHEAVEPPILDSSDRLQLGAGVDVLVVSTDVDDDHASTTRRTLVPPTGSFQLAEQHRMFDHSAGRVLARGAFDRSLRNAPLELPDPAAEGVFAFAPATPGGLDEAWEGEAEWPMWPAPGAKKVELIGLAGPDAAITLDFDDDGLTVRLPRGEQITVELSSTIRDNFLDHFAVGDWVTGEGTPPSWGEAASRGRHPMLSPVRRLTFVHVVKRPLAAPVWELPESRVARSAGTSFVDLAPTFQPAGLDTDSTARLEVGARWTEYADAGQVEQAVEQLHGVTIARGLPAIPAFRHEFGDSKHRTVTYRLTAISRFRHFFPDSDLDEAFQQSVVQPHTVNVLSSARPPLPRVVGTVPAFAFETAATQDRITRRRRVALRVELARPWFLTGEGERLAVVVAPAGAEGGTATRMGRDPIMSSSRVPSFAPESWFTGGLPSRSVELPEFETPLSVIPYDAQDAGDHWYADIWLDVRDAYAPFVQLVVARYQHDSIDGLRASGLVTCETIRALPDRLLVAERTGQGLRVTVTGQSSQPANRVEAVIDELPAQFDPASVELLALPGTEPSPMPAWRPRPETSVTGIIGQPLPPISLPPSTVHLRLRVREVENIPPDGSAVGPPELIEQTPYFDIVVLPPSWRTS
ncbi:hypothetical protein ACFWUU_05370 [Kribbella sp. NPDC058693]|uniref:hypothetical protein n=1 Tax=Kribbella sp. NPDC058693 TaxID=3346602 RepID=UPI003655F082